jgi:hypothetical protein
MGLALLCLIAAMLYPRRWFTRHRRDIYAVALTHNNRKALLHLGTALAQNSTLRIVVNDRTLSFGQKWLAWMRSPDRAGALSLLRRSGDADDFVLLQQILAVVSVAAFRNDLARAKPRVICVANDHSPACVGLLALARHLNIATCYAQHGPVTESFPPLSVDLAILSSESAHDAYRRAATRRGVACAAQDSISLLPTFTTPANPVRAPQVPMDVCIALSFFPDMAAAEALVRQLQSQKSVGQISVKQHPRCELDLSKTAITLNFKCLSKTAEICDLAQGADLCLVSNSGVALEFLHFGCPTFYWPEGDAARDDYYGFVAAGVLSRFDISFLEKPQTIHEVFDAAWHKRLGYVDPLATGLFQAFATATTDKFQELLHPDAR